MMRTRTFSGVGYLRIRDSGTSGMIGRIVGWMTSGEAVGLRHSQSNQKQGVRVMDKSVLHQCRISWSYGLARWSSLGWCHVRQPVLGADKGQAGSLHARCSRFLVARFKNPTDPKSALFRCCLARWHCADGLDCWKTPRKEGPTLKCASDVYPAPVKRVNWATLASAVVAQMVILRHIHSRDRIPCARLGDWLGARRHCL